jgi:hypothetical protein
MMATNPTVKANQRRMAKNALRAGNKLTDAQKKQFSGKELNKMRSELANESAHERKSRMASGVASKRSKLAGSGPLAGRARSGKKATAPKKAGKNLGKNVRRGTVTTGSGSNVGKSKNRNITKKTWSKIDKAGY